MIEQRGAFAVAGNSDPHELHSGQMSLSCILPLKLEIRRKVTPGALGRVVTLQPGFLKRLADAEWKLATIRKQYRAPARAGIEIAAKLTHIRAVRCHPVSPEREIASPNLLRALSSKGTPKSDKRRKESQRLQKLLAAQAKPTATQAGEVNALVIGIGPGLCTVDVDGAVRHVRCEIPVVPGDQVSVWNDSVSGIAPRRTVLTRTDPINERRERVIVANVDRMVIVAALINPPLRTGLIDRYMIAAARGGIQPLLCINKVDLSTNTSAVDSYEIPIVRCSTKTGQGIDELRDLLASSIAVLTGHSGVGKSSLLNALTGEDRARVGSVSEETGKGLHTTTASRLYHLKNGARIIDTPGVREFGLGPVTLDELKAAFPEFSGERCRFNDCTHKEEPDCAIRKAGGPRYEAWLRLLELR